MTALPPMSERAFQMQVTDLAKLFGWLSYHPYLSIHSARGWPDLALVRPPRLILAELKAEKGKTTEHQDRWLGLLRQCTGIEVFVWKPSDIEAIAEVLR